MSSVPALFLGHGNPLNAIRANEWTAAWSALGGELARPRAILAVSAHWYVEGTAVTAMSSPRTIHDFGGFPPELYAARYPAPGNLPLARHVQELLAPLAVNLDESWGLDHGSWSVLCHLYPDADVPVVQLSIDAREGPEFHYELGRRLRPLRTQGILILGSGNVVHNLRAYTWGERAAPPYAWALRFENVVRACLQAADHAPLIAYPTLGEDARLSVPTAEHYLPLLYVLGASAPQEAMRYPVAGVDGGSISMLGVQFG